MSLTSGIQIGFSETYPDHPSENIPSLLNGIPQSLLLKAVSGILAEQVRSIDNLRDFLEFWFRPSNTEFANDAYTRIRPIEKEFGNLIVAGVPAALKLYSYALNHLSEESSLTDEQMEINIFKAFLIQNDILNSIDAKITETTENLPFELRWCGSHFASAVRFSDVVNFDLAELFVSEFVRAVLFFEFLEAQPGAKPLLEKFYQIYQVQNWSQYLRQSSGISASILSKTKTGFLELTIPQGENFERDVNFLDTLSAVPYDELGDNDFKSLREKPLQKIDTGTYRIIFGLFCVERVFKGLYFNLKAVNQILPATVRINDFRNLYTYRFSEQHALYITLKKAFPKKYLCIGGEQISSQEYQGGPDFYVRNCNKIFLFESKDSLINASLKESGDFALLTNDLKSKFYVDGTKPKAAMQLLNGILDLFSERFLAIDSEYKKNFIRVYPIVVIHDRQLDVPGFNKIINSWFIPELEKMATKIDITRVKPITVIDTSTLILTNELLNSRQLMLEDIIDEYHRHVKFKQHYGSYEQLMQHGHDTTLPFSFYIRQVIKKRNLKRYPRKLLMEKAFIGLSAVEDE